MEGKWYVTEPNSQDEVYGSRGQSKEKAQFAFTQLMVENTGEDKPWVWWEKRGYRVRRD